MKSKDILIEFDAMPSKEDIKKITIRVNEFCKILKEIIKNKKIKADVFIGGSVAKGTFVKKEKNGSFKPMKGDNNLTSYTIEVKLSKYIEQNKKELEKMGFKFGKTANIILD